MPHKVDGLIALCGEQALTGRDESDMSDDLETIDEGADPETAMRSISLIST